MTIIFFFFNVYISVDLVSKARCAGPPLSVRYGAIEMTATMMMMIMMMMMIVVVVVVAVVVNVK